MNTARQIRIRFAYCNTAPAATAELRFNAVLLYAYRFPVINMSIMSIRLRTGLSSTSQHLSCPHPLSDHSYALPLAWEKPALPASPRVVIVIITFIIIVSLSLSNIAGDGRLFRWLERIFVSSCDSRRLRQKSVSLYSQPTRTCTVRVHAYSTH